MQGHKAEFSKEVVVEVSFVALEPLSRTLRVKGVQLEEDF